MDYNYKELMEELTSKTTISDKSVYYYDSSDIRDEFKGLFQFCQNALNDTFKSYYTGNGIFFFSNEDSLNARATKTNDYSLIEINRGLVEELSRMFLQNNELLEDVPRLTEYLEFEKNSLNIPIHVLMHQMAIHYTFYHELGHIIQMSELTDYETNENLDEKGVYSDQKHVFEIDADIFSSLNIASHIMQYNDCLFDGKIEKENIEKLIVTGCSAVFLHILSFRSNQVPLYYKESTHPHPIIRNIWIVSSVVSHIRQILQEKNIDIEIDTPAMLDKTFEFSEELICAQKLLSGALYYQFRNTLLENKTKIMEYMKEFEQLRSNDNSLSVNKRNKIARKNKTLNTALKNIM